MHHILTLLFNKIFSKPKELSEEHGIIPHYCKSLSCQTHQKRARFWNLLLQSIYCGTLVWLKPIKTIWLHTDMYWKKSILTAFLCNCEKFSLILCQLSTSGNLLKVSCNVESETTLNFSYSVKLIPLVDLLRWMHEFWGIVLCHFSFGKYQVTRLCRSSK